jgi:hypothetical protein
MSFMLSVTLKSSMLSFVMPSAVILNAIMLNVMAFSSLSWRVITFYFESIKILIE